MKPVLTPDANLVARIREGLRDRMAAEIAAGRVCIAHDPMEVIRLQHRAGERQLDMFRRRLEYGIISLQEYCGLASALVHDLAPARKPKLSDDTREQVEELRASYVEGMNRKPKPWKEVFDELERARRGSLMRPVRTSAPPPPDDPST